MAAGAAREGLQRPGRLHPLEVAEEARGLGDLDVAAHDDLRVTGGAPQLPAAPLLLEMRLVIEDDPALEHHLAVQQSPVVAARAQA
jgi:hypothetical protein